MYVRGRPSLSSFSLTIEIIISENDDNDGRPLTYICCLSHLSCTAVSFYHSIIGKYALLYQAWIGQIYHEPWSLCSHVSRDPFVKEKFY